MEVIPPDHPDCAARLTSLGNTLEMRFEQSGELPDLEEAIRLLRQAAQVIPPDHPDRADIKASLATALRMRSGSFTQT